MTDIVTALVLFTLGSASSAHFLRILNLFHGGIG